MTKETQPTDLSSWEMACSILVGVRKALLKAREEYDAATAASEGKLFTSGKGLPADVSAVMRDVERTLDYELSTIARSSNLKMPERKP